MNQAIFEKFYISNEPEDEFGVKLTFKAPYDQILDPIKEDLSQINTALKRKPEAVDGLADKAKGHIHDFFGCGPNLGQNKNPYSNYKMLSEIVKAIKVSAPVKVESDPELTNPSYTPESKVKTIKQKQKTQILEQRNQGNGRRLSEWGLDLCSGGQIRVPPKCHC